MGKTIWITDQEVDTKTMSFQVPWYRTSAAFNMLQPNVAINISKYRGNEWLEQLGEVDDIVGIFFDCDLEEESYQFLYELNHLQQLYFYTARNLSDIGFVANMTTLKNLCIYNSSIEQIAPIAELLFKQKEKQKTTNDFFEKLSYQLDNLAISKAKIADLAPLNGIEVTISEVIFSDNYISDLEPLKNVHCSYLDISHNKVESLEPFFNAHRSIYYLNATWNKIKTIEFMRAQFDYYDTSRFFIKNNEITDYTPLKNYRLIDTDVEIEYFWD